MNLYRIKIKLLSPLVTPLKGDTIWGHVVWGIANHEGESAVTEFLTGNMEKPSLVISSAFPCGCVCKPLPVPNKRTEILTKASYPQIKAAKKVHFEKAEIFLTVESEELPKKIFEEEVVAHNSINRITNTVQDGNLFTVSTHYPEITDFDIYAYSDFDEKRITELFTWGFENGYGADASIGMGNVKVLGNTEKIETKKDSSTYMALSPFVLSSKDVVKDLRADIFVRSGKVGGGFSTFMTPWKKTVVMYEEGAVFTSSKKIEYVGEIIGNIHQDPRIKQCGLAPVIPI